MAAPNASVVPVGWFESPESAQLVKDIHFIVSSLARAGVAKQPPSRARVALARQFKSKINAVLFHRFDELTREMVGRFRVADLLFIGWCFCTVAIRPNTSMTEATTQDVRVVEQRLRELLSMPKHCATPNEEETRAVCAALCDAAHLIVLFEGGDACETFVVPPEKNAWQARLMEKSEQEKQDDLQRQRMAKDSELHVVTDETHYDPGEADVSFRVPNVEMLNQVTAVDLVALASRVWYWWTLEQRLLLRSTIFRGPIPDINPGEIVARTSSAFAHFLDKNSRGEVTTRMADTVIQVGILRACPVGSLAAQLRAQRALDASKIVYTSISQNEMGVNLHKKFERIMVRSLGDLRAEREKLAEERDAPRDTPLPPSTPGTVALEDLDLAVSTWEIVITHKCMMRDSEQFMDLLRDVIVFEFELDSKRELLETTVLPSREPRRPLIIEFKRCFYVHVVGCTRVPVAWHKRGVIFAHHNDEYGNGRGTVLLEIGSFADAFVVWCNAVHRMFDGYLENGYNIREIASTLIY